MVWALLGIGTLCSLIGWIWVIVLAFQNGDTVWGVISIFCGIVGLVYGLMHFQQAKVPVILMAVGIICSIAVQVMAPGMMQPAAP